MADTVLMLGSLKTAALRMWTQAKQNGSALRLVLNASMEAGASGGRSPAAINVLEHADGAIHLKVNVGVAEPLEVISNIRQTGGTLHLENLSIYPESGSIDTLNSVGPKKLLRALNAIGKHFGADQVHVVGTPRVTGSTPGKVHQLNFKVRK